MTAAARLLSAVALLVLGPGCVTIESPSRAATAEVSGGGCPPGGSVVLTTAAGRVLGSTTADDRGAFRQHVELESGDDVKHPAVAVACGSTLIQLTVTLVDTPAKGTPVAWLGLAVGTGIMGAVAVVVLRRRAAASTIATAAPDGDQP